jgi:glycosyltransferase involved in cell wall biosynthesis
MHVAQFVHRYPPALGGAEAWAERLSRHLVNAGHRVTVWTTTAVGLSHFTARSPGELPSGDADMDGVRIRRFEPSFRFPGRRYLLKAASMLPVRSWQAVTQPWGPIPLGMWRAAAHPPADLAVVHAIAFPYGAIIQSAYRLARRARAPFVLTPFLHLGDPDDPNDPTRRAYLSPHLLQLLRRADRVLVQTPTEAAAVCSAGVAGERVIVQGLGVEATECTRGNRAQARARWGLGPGEIAIGHLATLSPEKGTPDLLAAARAVRQSGIPIRLVLAGPESPSLLWTHAEDEDGWVTRLGAISNTDRRNFFAAIDVFALPSRSDSFGLVFLEAWANGLPVIGYQAGGVPDVIRHERDGLLVRCGDLGGLAEAIRRLASDAELRTNWGQAGRDRTVREFRWNDKLERASRALTEWREPPVESGGSARAHSSSPDRTKP